MGFHALATPANGFFSLWAGIGECGHEQRDWLCVILLRAYSYLHSSFDTSKLIEIAGDLP
jgi:hypothetical protein